MIKILLITIPIIIEKPTKSFLYSFFHGLKKVVTNNLKDKNLMMLPFKDIKYKKIPKGDLIYQK